MLIKRTIEKEQNDNSLDEQRRFKNEERKKQKEKITQIRNVLQGFYPMNYQNYVVDPGIDKMTFTEEGLADKNFLAFMYNTCIAVFNNLDAFNIVFEEIAADILNKNPTFLEAVARAQDVCGTLTKIINHYRIRANTVYNFNPDLQQRYKNLLTKFEYLLKYARSKELCMTTNIFLQNETPNPGAASREGSATVSGEGSEAYLQEVPVLDSSASGGKKRHAMNKQTKKRRSKKRTSTRRRQRKNIRK
jgi:hypothetical protein